MDPSGSIGVRYEFVDFKPSDSRLLNPNHADCDSVHAQGSVCE